MTPHLLALVGGPASLGVLAVQVRITTFAVRLVRQPCLARVHAGSRVSWQDLRDGNPPSCQLNAAAGHEQLFRPTPATGHSVAAALACSRDPREAGRTELPSTTWTWRSYRSHPAPGTTQL